MDIQKLEQFLKERGEARFRLTQIKKAVFQDAAESFDEITSLPKELREELGKRFDVLPFSVEAVLESNDKKSFKALLKLADGKCIETVLMNPSDDAWSVCVSTQVGCAMKCAFCATGKLGFQRNLSSEEIWGQVLFWKQRMKEGPDKAEGRISHVVYMGMGEPFNNQENVFESIRALTDKEMLGLAQRGISVSTSGIVPGIEKFGEEFPQVNLAISLHAANNELRSELMPVNKAYDLEKLAGSLKKYFTVSNRQVFVEYILLDGKNDSMAHAKELADYLKTIGYRHLLHVNLIVFNPIQGAPFKSSSQKQAREFRNFLIKNGISATIRKSMGQDIEGACGQLAGRK